MANGYNIRAYTRNQPETNLFQPPIVAKRAPTVNDRGYALGQVWIYVANNAAYILTSVVSNVATWQLLEVNGGAGVFATLTVTPGPIGLSGTTTINTVGAGTTAIGVGGTGAVTIGNATGNTVISAGNLTVTSGAFTVSAGLSSLSALTQVGTANINTSGAAVTNIGVAGTGAVNIGNATGDTTIPAGNLTLTLGDLTVATGNISATIGAVTGDGLYAAGDLGGVASQNSLSNVVATAAGGGTVTFGANGAGNIVQTGWMKMYVGVTAVYIPYFSAI